MAKRKKRLKKAQPGINVTPAKPVYPGQGLIMPGIPGKKYPNTREGHRQRMMDESDIQLKRIQNPKPYIHPSGPGVIRRDPNQDFPFIKPNNTRPDLHNYNPRMGNLQKGGMTNQDLSKIQSSNAKKNVMFNIMKDAYDKRNKQKGGEKRKPGSRGSESNPITLDEVNIPAPGTKPRKKSNRIESGYQAAKRFLEGRPKKMGMVRS